jgi:hypothetical protein
VKEKLVKSTEIDLDPGALVLPGEFNAMKNCVCCKERLAIINVG